VVHYNRSIKSRRFSFDRGGGPVETEDDGLVDSEVDGLVETGTKFDCPVEGLKYGTGEPVSETTSKGSSCNNPEEAFNNLIPEDFSSNHTFHLIMIFHLTGSNNR
jgi:hypothetical protein